MHNAACPMFKKVQMTSRMFTTQRPNLKQTAHTILMNGATWNAENTRKVRAVRYLITGISQEMSPYSRGSTYNDQFLLTQPSATSSPEQSSTNNFVMNNQWHPFSQGGSQFMATRNAFILILPSSAAPCQYNVHCCVATLEGKICQQITLHMPYFWCRSYTQEQVLVLIETTLSIDFQPKCWNKKSSINEMPPTRKIIISENQVGMCLTRLPLLASTQHLYLCCCLILLKMMGQKRRHCCCCAVGSVRHEWEEEEVGRNNNEVEKLGSNVCF